MRYKLGGVLLIVVFAASLLGGWLGDRVRAEGPAANRDNLEQLLKSFTESFAYIQREYAQEVDSTELVENAIRGMLRTLDPHSNYFAASDYSKLQEEQSGKYFGLGILIRPERPGSGRVVIVEPPEAGTPGYREGLRPGDVISKIEGQAIDDWEYPDEIIPRLKGPKGTTVRITVERPGEPEPLEIEIERAAIPLYTIKYAFFVRPGVGYLRIDKFSESTSEELDGALAKLGEEHLKGLVLDLRNNPGGSLNQAIQVSDRFLNKYDVIVSTRGRGGRDQRQYRAPKGRRYTYPMVVLINQHSASASEIVAGALQDHDRALIVGETSFGKALVQTVYPLRANRGLALTTGKYYTPSDRLIQRPYNQGFFDYFYARRFEGADEGESFSTDGGRTVFAGGGIRPDVEQEATRYTRLAASINRRNLFQKFVGMLIRGEVKGDTRYEYDSEKLRELDERARDELAQRIYVRDDGETMRRFKEFLVDQPKIRLDEEEFKASRYMLANRLSQEVIIALLGDREGMRVQLEIDKQVQTAIEKIPEAKALLEQNKNPQ